MCQLNLIKTPDSLQEISTLKQPTVARIPLYTLHILLHHYAAIGTPAFIKFGFANQIKPRKHINIQSNQHILEKHFYFFFVHNPGMINFVNCQQKILEIFLAYRLQTTP